MIQQVNLYQGVLNQSQSGGKFRTILWTLATLILLLVGYCGYIAWNTHNLKSILNLRESDLQASKAALELLQSNYPETQPDRLLISEITRAQKKLDSLSQVAHLLADQQADHNQGFSKYLRALANQATREVWLNTIYIDSNAKIFSLKGSATRAAQVPSFLRKLQNEKVFHGKTFANLNMVEPEAWPNQIDFAISTTTVPVDESLP